MATTTNPELEQKRKALIETMTEEQVEPFMDYLKAYTDHITSELFKSTK